MHKHYFYITQLHIIKRIRYTARAVSMPGGYSLVKKNNDLRGKQVLKSWPAKYFKTKSLTVLYYFPGVSCFSSLENKTKKKSVTDVFTKCVISRCDNLSVTIWQSEWPYLTVFAISKQIKKYIICFVLLCFFLVWRKLFF